MAMFLDPSDALGRQELLREFGSNLRGAAAGPSVTGAFDAAGRAIGGAAAEAVPKGPRVDPFVERIAARLGKLFSGTPGIPGAESTLGRLAGRVSGVAQIGSGVIGLADPNPNPNRSTFNDVVDIGLGIGAQAAPALRTVSLAKQGVDLGVGAIGAVAESQERPILSADFAKQVQAAGGTGAFVKGVQEKQGKELDVLIKQDAEAQKFTDARTARVNQVIAESKAGREQDAQVAAAQVPAATLDTRRADAEAKLAALPAPRAITSFSNFSRGAQSTIDFLTQRNNLARQSRALLTESEGEKNRAVTRDVAAGRVAVDREKLTQEFQKQLMDQAQKQRETKVVTVKSGLEEIPVLVNATSGRPVAGFGVKGGQPTALEPAIQIPRSQALLEAQTRLETAPQKERAKLKRQLNEKLKQEYGDSAPQIP